MSLFAVANGDSRATCNYLVAVGVTDSGDHGLIGDHRFDAAGATGQQGGQPFGIDPNASGPNAAMPGTMAGSSTNHTASRWVPASREIESAPSRCTRRAIGPYPASAEQVTTCRTTAANPARDRCVMRYRSPTCTPEVLPHRLASVTVRPCRALSGGSNVFNGGQRGHVDAQHLLPDRVMAQMRGEGLDLGVASGISPVCPRM